VHSAVIILVLSQVSGLVNAAQQLISGAVALSDDEQPTDSQAAEDVDKPSGLERLVLTADCG